jgi:hypothetical protein
MMELMKQDGGSTIGSDWDQCNAYRAGNSHCFGRDYGGVQCPNAN